MKSVAIFVMEAMKNIHPATHADQHKCVNASAYGIKVIAHPRYVYTCISINSSSQWRGET